MLEMLQLYMNHCTELCIYIQVQIDEIKIRKYVFRLLHGFTHDLFCFYFDFPELLHSYVFRAALMHTHSDLYKQCSFILIYCL